MSKTIFLLQIALSAMVLTGPCTTGFAQTPANRYKAHKNHRPLFSISYPEHLVVQEWPDGVILIDEKLSWPRDVIQVSNDAFPRGYFNYASIRVFEILRRAKRGEIKPRLTDFGSGIYRKIENITVDGYPAVKVIYDSIERMERAGESTPEDSGTQPPPIYVVSVYIKHHNKIWEISSLASSKAMREERALIFESILSTLKFR